MSTQNSILTTCRKGTAYSTRIDTDQLFQAPEGSFTYTGSLDQAIRFVEKNQLCDPELWTLFVDQFRSTPDDHDLGWRSEYWGKMMRGACFTYSYTQNESLYRILEDTVKDLITAQDEKGRITSYSVEAELDGWDIWGRKYILLGFQYFIEICKDSALIEKVISVMCKHADYLLDHLGAEEDGKKQITKASRNWYGLNSSSILEPYVRLYNITGEKRYLDFSTYIVNCGGTSIANIFELAYEGKLYPYQYPVVKAYEMMSCFEGLLEYYRVTKIEKWRIAAINFAKLIAESDITIIGSSGCTHELFDHSTMRQLATAETGIVQETCVTVTWMKYCYQILCITGESFFVDQIEQSVYNALLGAINTEKNKTAGGLPFDSYSPLLMNTRARGVGGRKTIKGDRFYGCCAAIGAAGTGLIPLVSTMLKQDGIAVNLYIPGKGVLTTPQGKKLELITDTEYPKEGTVKISIHLEQDEQFSISLRIPAWSAKNFVSLNGIPVDSVKAGEYTVIDRLWSNQDTLVLTFDLRASIILPAEPYADQHSKYHVALKRGPILFARDARLEGNIEEPVSILCDKDGYVELKPTHTASFEKNFEFSVPTTDGNFFTVVDYASAGKTWDEKSMMTAWLPTQNYWAVDFKKPLYAICSATKRLAVTKDDVLNIKVEKREAGDCSENAWILENTENESYRIQVKNSGKYLTCRQTENGEIISLEEKNDSELQLWCVQHFVQNRYHIVNKSNNKNLSEIRGAEQIKTVDGSVDNNQMWELYNI